MRTSLELEYSRETTAGDQLTLKYTARRLAGVWILVSAPQKKNFKLFHELSSFSSWSYRDAETRFSEMPELEETEI